MIVRKIIPRPIKKALKPCRTAIRKVFERRETKAILKSRILLTEKETHFVILIAYPQMWSTIKPVYNESTRKGIKITVLALPRFIEGRPSLINEANLYFQNIGVSSMPAYNPASNEWLSLRSLEPSHVFYIRPYEQEYPPEYLPGAVSLYATTCLVPYSDITYIEDGHYEIIFNRQFLSKVNHVFTCSQVVTNTLRQDFAFNLRSGMLHLTEIPDPRLESTFKEFEKNKGTTDHFTIVYTPRWAVQDNPDLTSFFSYIKPLIDYVLANEDVHLILRPHPLAFENFIKEGRMTPSEVNELIRFLENNPRFKYESGGDYIPGFIDADVMLSDASSLVREFFLSGKPILYAGGAKKVRGSLRSMYSSLYEVEKWEDIEASLHKLRDGIDPKKNERSKVLASFNLAAGSGNLVIRSLVKQDGKQSTVEAVST